MTTSLVLIVAVGVLVAAGVVLILERSLSRVLLGVALLGNGVNLMILATGGKAGSAPIEGTSKGRLSDPLPHVMILTSIVITLGLTAFLLALAYRSWQLTGNDEVQDDVEDRLVARRAEADAEEHADDLDAGADADAEAAADALAGRDAVARAPGTGAPILAHEAGADAGAGAAGTATADDGVAPDDAGTDDAPGDGPAGGGR